MPSGEYLSGEILWNLNKQVITGARGLKLRSRHSKNEMRKTFHHSEDVRDVYSESWMFIRSIFETGVLALRKLRDLGTDL